LAGTFLTGVSIFLVAVETPTALIVTSQEKDLLIKSNKQSNYHCLPGISEIHDLTNLLTSFVVAFFNCQKSLLILFYFFSLVDDFATLLF
jgi:hypothetical protein